MNKQRLVVTSLGIPAVVVGFMLVSHEARSAPIGISGPGNVVLCSS